MAKKMLSASDRRKIRAMWETGEYSMDEIAKEVGNTVTAVKSYIDNNAIKKGSRSDEIQQAVMKKTKETAETEATLVASRIRETKEEHYKMSMAIAKLIWKEVLDCNKAGRPFADVRGNIASLELASRALANCRSERWVVLGLDKDNVSTDRLPELVLTELTAEQIEEIRNYQEEDSLELPDEDLNKAFEERNAKNLVDTDTEVVEHGGD